MVKNFFSIAFFAIASTCLTAQVKQNLNEVTLWQLGRLGVDGMSSNGKSVDYTVASPSVSANKSSRVSYNVDLSTGESITTAARTLSEAQQLDNAKMSPDGKKVMYTQEVLLDEVVASDKHKDLPKSNAYVYTTLNFRHWDEYEDGKYSHIFVADVVDGKPQNAIDIMKDEKYDCPQKPHGGAEDMVWSPDGKSIVYVCKKKFGTAYATSTNTDLYEYNLATQKTTNISASNLGYDMAPAFSPDGKSLAWLSMKRDGFEADKQDVIVMDWKTKTTKNATAFYDETINAFIWNNASTGLWLEVPYRGTIQLFYLQVANEIALVRTAIKPVPVMKQITNGQFDINGLVGQGGNNVIVTRSDMNHATELFSVDATNGKMYQLSHVNDSLYEGINMCRVEPFSCKSTDGKDLFSWIVYPPNFDANKKYPTLLYCQGGPQGTISQFYSFRWNFQLMASKGYIVIVPNRRGCHGWGVKWNEDISKDWGGQSINDYLSAFDAFSKKDFVDKKRCAAVGASYGGYSVFMLAGVHGNRFKSFIAHDGLFDLRSWYGTTEELWFAKWDIGGPYWKKDFASNGKHNPVSYIEKWNTPIMIVQGGKDYRVGVEQGFAAFQTAQLKGIKSKLLYLPEENHWVLKAQNAQVWQREFYSWLQETLQ